MSRLSILALAIFEQYYLERLFGFIRFMITSKAEHPQAKMLWIYIKIRIKDLVKLILVNSFSNIYFKVRVTYCFSYDRFDPNQQENVSLMVHSSLGVT